MTELMFIAQEHQRELDQIGMTNRTFYISPAIKLTPGNWYLARVEDDVVSVWECIMRQPYQEVSEQ